MTWLEVIKQHTSLTKPVFYTTKEAEKSHHPIPSGLKEQDASNILHDHPLLAAIFWPSRRIIKQGEDSPTPRTTHFSVGSASGSETSYKTSLTSQFNEKEVILVEDMPLGLKMTVAYRVISGEDIPSESPNENDVLEATPNGLYLEVERSVQSPRPLSLLVRVKDGPIQKTRDLLWVLDEMGRNGKNLAAALGALRIRDDGTDRGKDKAD